MNLKLKGKLIVVGGGEGGVGKALCRELEGMGAKVIPADIKSGLDLSDPNAVQQFFSDLRQDYPRLNGYVSAVYDGQTAAMPFIGVTPEQVQIGINGSLLAAFYPIQEAVKWMAETGGGHIVVVSTVNTRLGLGEGPYEMAKGAVNRIAPNIATKYGGKGICAITLLAGTIAPTPPWEGHDDLLEQVRKTIPDGKVTTPQEISKVIAFLLSPYAKVFNGAELEAYRGWTLPGPVLGFDKTSK